MTNYSVTICVLLAVGFGFGQTAPTPSKPLGRVEPLALRIDGVSDARLVTLLRQRGITFQPDEAYRRMLQDAGATSDMLTALDTGRMKSAADGTSTDYSSASEDSVAREAAVLAHLDRGAQLDRNRFHPREAEPEYRAAVDADPTNAFGHLVMGDILARLGQRDPAIKEFREAVRLQPDTAEAHFGLAETLYRREDRQEVLGEFDRALTLAPDDARFRRAYANSLELDGKEPEAEEQRRIAQQLSPAGDVPARIRIDDKVMQARLIFQPNPKYPHEAKENRIQGTVAMEALIASDGSVIDVEVISGDPALVKAATDAVMQWRYQPVHNRTVQVITEIDINFTLAEQDTAGEIFQ
jgi:TonB family protein